MKFIRRKSDSSNKISGWQLDKDGFEKTYSAAFVSEAITRLLKDRILLSLASKDYQSSITMLTDFDQKQLVFAKPEEWPDTQSFIRVIFKDAEKMWSHFDVNVLHVTRESLIATKPKTLFRLQRRDHYRMLTPRGSFASFVFAGKKYEGFYAHDISAGGMMLCTKKRPSLTSGDVISELSITLPAIEHNSDFFPGEHVFHIPMAKVIHVYQNEQIHFLRFGLGFMINKQIEEDIVKHIRQLELETLRKWI